MRSAGFVLFAAITLLFVAGCNNPSTVGPTQQQPTVASSPQATQNVADEFAAIRTVFKDHCVKCHGDTGGGGRVQVEGREIKVPNLTGAHARKPSDERLAAKIANGDDEMPAFKDKLSQEQIQELVRFIRKEFQEQQ